METKEIIERIEALVDFAKNALEQHGSQLALVRPSWLQDLPIAQFVEVCEAYPHDDVSRASYPSTWLLFGKMQLSITCERVDLLKINRGDFIEELRAMTPNAAAA